MKSRKSFFLTAMVSIFTVLFVNYFYIEKLQASDEVSQANIRHSAHSATEQSFFFHFFIIFSLAISIVAMVFSLRAWYRAARQGSLEEEDQNNRHQNSKWRTSGDFRSEILDDQGYIDGLERWIVDSSTSTNANRYLDYLEWVRKKLAEDPDISGSERAKLEKLEADLLQMFEMELKTSNPFNREEREEALREARSLPIEKQERRELPTRPKHPN
jgi:hypothetical protein